MAEEAWIVLLAVGLDLAFREPPRRLHPVVWMGKLITFLEAHSPKNGALAQVLYGAVLVGGGLAILLFLLFLLLRWVQPLLDLLGLLVSAFLLKTTFSIRGLIEAALAVKRPLLARDLDEARRLLALSLVSRETKGLDQGHVASGVIESVAENLTDSIIAPLLFYAFLGLYGAFAYRFVNTADAMLGYREGRYEHLGKAAARLDDLLNLVPARVAGLLIVFGAFLTGEDLKGAWRTMLKEHRRTASPNAGWTMAAMAGALGVALEKIGYYALGGGKLPGPSEIGRSLRVLMVATCLFVIVEAFILGIL